MLRPIHTIKVFSAGDINIGLLASAIEVIPEVKENESPRYRSRSSTDVADNILLLSVFALDPLVVKSSQPDVRLAISPVGILDSCTPTKATTKPKYRSLPLYDPNPGSGNAQ